MIAITKGDSPTILTEKGLELTNNLKLAFENGERKFEFDSAVYGGKTVKSALIRIQHNKCCFCESSLHAQHGDVEHFRPKGGWIQEEKDKLSEVGYYWLAYDWDNMFLACQKCNQTFKKNYFPIENPIERALNHTHDVTKELHLIINPSIDNPKEHLLFKKEIITSKTAKGKETIKRTAIDQETFEEDRRTYFQAINTLLDCLKLFNENQISSPDGQTILRTIKDLVHPKKPYYAMLRDNFQKELLKLGVEIS
jgi:uncharacterized protein (TIGR02646 family)